MQEKTGNSGKLAGLPEQNSLQSFLQLNKTLFNDEPNSPASLCQSARGSSQQPQMETPQSQVSYAGLGQDEQHLGSLEDDTCSNSSDPERLEIEDREVEAASDDGEENGYDMSVGRKRPKLEQDATGPTSPANAASPINRMDTPESNCSDTQVDHETTKLWQALAR